MFNFQLRVVKKFSDRLHLVPLRYTILLIVILSHNTTVTKQYRIVDSTFDCVVTFIFFMQKSDYQKKKKKMIKCMIQIITYLKFEIFIFYYDQSNTTSYNFVTVRLSNIFYIMIYDKLNYSNRYIISWRYYKHWKYLIFEFNIFWRPQIYINEEF